MLSSVIEIHVSVTLWQLVMFYLISFGGFVKGVLSLNLLCFWFQVPFSAAQRHESVFYTTTVPSPWRAEGTGAALSRV